MPNSPWTVSGSSIDLAPTITAIVLEGSLDYLTNADKIALMQQYAAELATKTQLDEQAAALGLTTQVTSYDNAVGAINTTLVDAGAPSNWATIWPDGTTFGPVVGIKTLLSGDWASIATNRSDLQAAISAAQAAAAQAAAVSAAAADATTKMDAAIAAADTAAATAQSNAIAAANTAASAAQAAAIAKAAVMAASQSIVSNGAFTTGDDTGWALSDGSGTFTFGPLPDGSNGITLPGGGDIGVASPSFQLMGGQKYKISFWVYAGSGSQNTILRVNWNYTTAFPNITDGLVADGDQFDFLHLGSIATTPTYYSFDWTPGITVFASLCVFEWMGGTAPVYIKGVYAVPYVEAAYIDAGAVTADAIAAGAITAGSIAAGAITAGSLAAGSVTTAALAAGSVTTSILAASAVESNNIAAGAITTNKLTVTSTGLALNSDPFCMDVTAWAIGDSGSYSEVTVTDGLVGTTAFQMTNTNIRSLSIPITPGNTYRVTVTARGVGAAAPVCYIRFYQYGAATTCPASGWPTGSLIAFSTGNESITVPSTWTQYTATITAASGAAWGCLSFHANWESGAVQVQIQDFELDPQVGASLIVDGTITASQIAAGAITGDMITTGVLTASVIYFTDGFCLNTLEPAEAGSDVTLSHILTAQFSLAGSLLSFISTSPQEWYLLPSAGWTVATAATSDVYNVNGVVVFQFTEDRSSDIPFVTSSLGIVVDGDTSTIYGVGPVTWYDFAQDGSGLNMGQGATATYGVLGSITGLSPGAHTIQLVYDFNGWAGLTGMDISQAAAICQRIF